MADKRINDFATLDEAQDNDLVLVSSENETYNMKIKTFKDAVAVIATQAENAAATAVQKASDAKNTAENALNIATQANTCSQNAETNAAQAATDATVAAKSAEAASESASASYAVAEQAQQDYARAVAAVNEFSDLLNQSGMAKSDLLDATTAAITTKSQLAAATEDANTTQDNLEAVTSDAVQVVTSAATAKSQLEAATENATTASGNLSAAIGNVDYVATCIEDIKSYLGYIDKDIAGLQVDYKNGTFKRLAGAYGKSMGKDFNAFPMYGNRKRCNVENDGTIIAYYGDEEYLDDDNPQVMVYQPAFWYKVVPLEYEKIENGIGYHLRKANYYVSSRPKLGFKRHPAFYDEQGNPIDYILFSAYEGSMLDVSRSHSEMGDHGMFVNDSTDSTTIEYEDGDLLCSTGGQKPISGLRGESIGTRQNLETMAHNRGAGWHLSTIKAECANLLLMIIEMGTMNSQEAIGTGIGAISHNRSYNCASLTGSTANLGNNTGRAEQTTNEIGGTEVVYTDEDKVAVTYRGIENPWGNIIKYVNGINIWGNGTMNGGQPYIADDFNFNENTHINNYKPAGFTLANTNGYISAMGWGGDENSDYDWLLLPSECGGDSALPVGDYCYHKPNLDGYKAVALGGNSISSIAWMGISAMGALQWFCNYDSNYRTRLIGGRIIYIPTAAQTA